MLYLALAVLASSAVAIIMRLAEPHVKNNFAMFMANYFVCSSIALAYTGSSGALRIQEGTTFALLLGLVSGGLYLLNFVLLKLSIGRSGVTLASVFMKLGVIVPALIAVIAFGEEPTVPQMLGFALAVAAILIIYIEPGKEKSDIGSDTSGSAAAGGSLLLLVLLIVSGVTNSMTNIYDKVGEAAVKDQFLFFNFFTAFLLSGAITLIKHERVSWKDILFGVLIGIPNYHASRFLLLALGSVPAVVSYPVYNVGAIVLISIAGVLLFKEKLGRRKLIGIAMIVAALVLLNL